MNKTLLTPLSLAALLLTGCAAESPAPEETEPVPVVESATENQVSSVLAEYEPEWRERIEEAGDCRFTWTLGGSTIAEEIGADACFIAEKTMGITSQLVIRDWDALVIPQSMVAIVDDTSKVIAAISEVDLKLLCGDEARPADTQACTDALGSRNFLYNQLESELDKWAPYL
jgi:hypothetical protein